MPPSFAFPGRTGTAAISFDEGYLINSGELCLLAAEAGLSMVHMINLGEFFDHYVSLYGEHLKRKCGSKELLSEQRQVLDMYAILVFQKQH